MTDGKKSNPLLAAMLAKKKSQADTDSEGSKGNGTSGAKPSVAAAGLVHQPTVAKVPTQQSGTAVVPAAKPNPFGLPQPSKGVQKAPSAIDVLVKGKTHALAPSQPKAPDGKSKDSALASAGDDPGGNVHSDDRVDDNVSSEISVSDDSREDQPTRANPLAKVLAEKTEARQWEILTEEPPKDFKALLDRFDSILKSQGGIDDFNIDTMKKYVGKIYVDLQNQPELDGLMADRDAANIVMFIRSTREQAVALGTEKKVKAEKKAKNVKAKDRFGGSLDFDLVDMPGSLDDLADFDMGDL